MFASLIALNSFHLLTSTQLTTNLTLEWSGGSMFHPLSHIYAKTPFCCAETTFWIVDALLFLIDCSKSSTHFEHSFLVDKCVCKMVNTLSSDIFDSSAISRNFNLLSVKTSLWSFFFSRTTAESSNSAVQHRLCLYDHILSEHTTT